MEKKDHDLNKQLETIINLIPGMIYCKNKDDVVTMVNQNFADSLKLDKKDIIGKTTFDLFPKDQANKFRKVDLEIIKSGKVKLNYEESGDFPDGKVYTITSKVPFIDDKGEISGIVGLSIDITERKKMEDKLKESKEKFCKAFESNAIPMGISELESGRFVEVNNIFLKNLDFKKEEVIGKSGADLNLWVEGDYNGLLKLIEEKGSVTNMDLLTRTKNGNIRHSLFSASKIIINNKPYLLTMANDITERVEAEKKLKESEENYRRAYEHENFYKDLFTHDMNNILQSMLMSLELSEIELENIDNFVEIKKILGGIKDQINRGTNLVNNVNKFSQIDTSTIKLYHFDVIEGLKQSIKIAEKISGDKKVEISIDSKCNNPKILADEFLIDVFENILINAIKHNNNQIVKINVNISIIYENQNELLRVEFKDNGKGIPESRKKTIFDRGVCCEVKSESGLGLGLSLTKKIVDRYNANIWIEDNDQNDISKGSVFIITFPLKAN